MLDLCSAFLYSRLFPVVKEHKVHAELRKEKLNVSFAGPYASLRSTNTTLLK